MRVGLPRVFFAGLLASGTAALVWLISFEPHARSVVAAVSVALGLVMVLALLPAVALALILRFWNGAGGDPEARPRPREAARPLRLLPGPAGGGARQVEGR